MHPIAERSGPEADVLGQEESDLLDLSPQLGLSRGLGRTGPAASRARLAAHHRAGSFTTRLLRVSVT
jgi:hypothetical protein